KELDKLPLQVLLEATIAEVSLEDRLSYGIQWFFGNDQANVALSEFPNRSVGEFFSTGFSGLISRGDVRIVLNALDEASEVNVISSPQILVLDNQTAQLEVGDEVPIVTQQAENVDNTDSRIVSTVEQRQTGVILNVTPRVNASGLVVLDIEQEVSDVVRTTTSGIDSPTIAQRRIGTSVAVGNDQTVVLGGLIQDDVDDIASGVPFLRDIPIIGFLFGTTTKITSRTELLVLISPKVLTSQEEAVEVTEELRRRLRVLEPLQAKIAGVTADRQQEPQPFERGHAEPSRKGYVVQLTSLPSEADARRAWDDYQQRHGDDLRALTPIIKKSEVEGGPIYGLQAGWFDSFVTADQLCAKLIPQGTDCLVIEKH
ncbi:MAG: SPOR domain-containing protein, partial [Geminicoccaceae bacterium]